MMTYNTIENLGGQIIACRAIIQLILKSFPKEDIGKLVNELGKAEVDLEKHQKSSNASDSLVEGARLVFQGARDSLIL